MVIVESKFGYLGTTAKDLYETDLAGKMFYRVKTLQEVKNLSRGEKKKLAGEENEEVKEELQKTYNDLKRMLEASPQQTYLVLQRTTGAGIVNSCAMTYESFKTTFQEKYDNILPGIVVTIESKNNTSSLVSVSQESKETEKTEPTSDKKGRKKTPTSSAKKTTSRKTQGKNNTKKPGNRRGTT